MLKNGKILLYVLEGAWNTQDTDGNIVVGVSEDEKPLIEKLDQIEKNKAADYLQGGLSGKIEEERWDRMYEVRDEEAGWARFCITEHYVEISKSLMIPKQKARELVIRNVYRNLDSLGYGKKRSGSVNVTYIVKGKTMTLSEYEAYCIRRELKKWGIKIRD